MKGIEYAQSWVKFQLVEFPNQWRKWKVCVKASDWFLKRSVGGDNVRGVGECVTVKVAQSQQKSHSRYKEMQRALEQESNMLKAVTQKLKLAAPRFQMD